MFCLMFLLIFFLLLKKKPRRNLLVGRVPSKIDRIRLRRLLLESEKPWGSGWSCKPDSGFWLLRLQSSLDTVVRCTDRKEPPSGTRLSLSVTTKRLGYVSPNSRTVTRHFHLLTTSPLGADLDGRHCPRRALRRSSSPSNQITRRRR